MNIGYGCSKKKSPLYVWIGVQRLRRKAFPNRHYKYRIMTKAEIDALDTVGFDWKFCAVPDSDRSNDQTAADLQQQQASSGNRGKKSTSNDSTGEEEMQGEGDDAKMPAIERPRSPSIDVNHQEL